MPDELLDKGEVVNNNSEGTMTREELPAKSTYVGDDLTEAERKYFESGGQDVSALLDDPVYQSDADSLKAERDAIEEQKSKTSDDPNASTYQEIKAKAPGTTEETKQKQETTQQPEVKEGPTEQQTLGDEEEFEFEELQVGQDGRLRDKSGRFVPLSALHKERDRFKAQRDSNVELNRQNEELRSKYDKLSERIATLQEVWTKPAQQETESAEKETPKTISQGLRELLTADDIPSPEEDIFAHANWQKNVIQKSFDAIAALEEMVQNNAKEIVEKEIQPVKQQLTEQDVVNYYRQDAQNFVSQKPEFADAYRYLMNQRHATLAMAGFSDANERQNQIRQEERDLVDMAIKQNQRPAEFIFNYAVASGYRPPVAENNTQPTTEQPQPTTAQPPIQPPHQPAETTAAPAQPTTQSTAQNNAAERLLNQVNAQNASATLSGTGGSASETLTAEAIANMSERDFIALSDKLGRHGMRQFLGGNA